MSKQKIKNPLKKDGSCRRCSDLRLDKKAKTSCQKLPSCLAAGVTRADLGHGHKPSAKRGASAASTATGSINSAEAVDAFKAGEQRLQRAKPALRAMGLGVLKWHSGANPGGPPPTASDAPPAASDGLGTAAASSSSRDNATSSSSPAGGGGEGGEGGGPRTSPRKRALPERKGGDGDGESRSSKRRRSDEREGDGAAAAGSSEISNTPPSAAGGAAGEVLAPLAEVPATPAVAQAEEVEALRTQLAELKQQLAQTQAAAAATAAAAVREEAEKRALSKFIGEVAASKAELNSRSGGESGFCIPQSAMLPLVSITAQHAYLDRKARTDGNWTEGAFGQRVISTPLMDLDATKPPSRDAYFAAGIRVVFVDWRCLGQTRYRCCRCGCESMSVVEHNLTVEGGGRGLKIDKYTATDSKVIGVPTTYPSRTLLPGVVLKCRDCAHYTNMSAPEIVRQMPVRLQWRFPGAAHYITTGWVFDRTFTHMGESLFLEGPTSVTSYLAAAGEAVAWGYETARIEYAIARMDYLDAGGDPELVADTPGESDAHVFYWGTPSAGAYNACFKKELAEQTQVHNLEMQSLPVPDGGLLHMSYDDNTAIAKSVQLTGSNPNVKVGLATSAHTGFITSVALKSSGTWEAQEAQIDKLVEHHGEPRIFCTDNLPVNLSALKAKMPTTCPTLDYRHYYARTKNTFRSYSAEYGRLAAELNDEFLETVGSHTSYPAGEAPVGSRQYFADKCLSGDFPTGTKVRARLRALKPHLALISYAPGLNVLRIR